MNRFFNVDFDQDLSALNVKEKELEIELAAPGLSKENFKISIENGILSILGENENFVRKEFSYNGFSQKYKFTRRSRFGQRCRGEIQRRNTKDESEKKRAKRRKKQKQ